MKPTQDQVVENCRILGEVLTGKIGIENIRDECGTPNLAFFMNGLESHIFRVVVGPTFDPWSIWSILTLPYTGLLIYVRTGHLHQIVSATHSGVFMCGFGNRKIPYAELLRDFVQRDGSPCGVKRI